ncbi:hypothetical protein SEMRO_583_G170690.1 [Seminavis robusta]|uniref:Uncharacterized protein n=1 Tax=Seminavis robusta TaxID=568900 RepID=A0A9N8HJZ9_9STRA|nr:hypothetical protein SEMRO_583_G170690.1 [Seminavis robusta]|eukprot:Sro583_g170690.1 n/a (181) ;mRNA; r:43832-44374
MPYDFKTKEGGIYSASCRRPPCIDMLPIEDFDLYLTRISKCVAHSIRKESDEILVWYFENSKVLSSDQAKELHSFLLQAENVNTTFVSMDRRALIIKTVHGEQITVMLACKYSRFYIAPPCERPHESSRPKIGMAAVLTEMLTIFSGHQNEQEQDATPSVVDLLSPCSAAHSEFTLESMD